MLMNQITNTANAFFNHAMRRWIGDHQCAQTLAVFLTFGGQIIDIDVTVVIAFATAFADAIRNSDNRELNVVHDQFFDTVVIDCGSESLATQIFANADNLGYNLWRISDTKLSVSFSETSDQTDFQVLTQLFVNKAQALPKAATLSLADAHLRTDDILTHPVFNSHHTEHEMLRYLKSLEDKDLAMNRSMISLGSCTMKLNATSEMLPITWPEFANVHPFAPATKSPATSR